MNLRDQMEEAHRRCLLLTRRYRRMVNTAQGLDLVHPDGSGALNELRQSYFEALTRARQSLEDYKQSLSIEIPSLLQRRRAS